LGRPVGQFGLVERLGAGEDSASSSRDAARRVGRDDVVTVCRVTFSEISFDIYYR